MAEFDASTDSSLATQLATALQDAGSSLTVPADPGTVPPPPDTDEYAEPVFEEDDPPAPQVPTRQPWEDRLDALDQRTQSVVSKADLDALADRLTTGTQQQIATLVQA